jgi:hypothetical protein
MVAERQVPITLPGDPEHGSYVRPAAVERIIRGAV